jgi:hypothetical protein
LGARRRKSAIAMPAGTSRALSPGSRSKASRSSVLVGAVSKVHRRGRIGRECTRVRRPRLRAIAAAAPPEGERARPRSYRSTAAPPAAHPRTRGLSAAAAEERLELLCRFSGARRIFLAWSPTARRNEVAAAGSRIFAARSRRRLWAATSTSRACSTPPDANSTSASRIVADRVQSCRRADPPCAPPRKPRPRQRHGPGGRAPGLRRASPGRACGSRASHPGDQVAQRRRRVRSEREERRRVLEDHLHERRQRSSATIGGRPVSACDARARSR